MEARSQVSRGGQVQSGRSCGDVLSVFEGGMCVWRRNYIPVMPDIAEGGGMEEHPLSSAQLTVKGIWE